MSGVALSAVPSTTSAADAAEPLMSKFQFDGDFQSRIAALTLRDTSFNQMVDGLVEPGHFESEIESYLVSLALRYWSKYRKAPANIGIYAMLLREDLDAKVLPKALGVAAIAHLKNLFETDISDRDFVVDQVATFARHQAMQAAMFKAIPKLDRNDFDGISKLMQTALNVGANAEGDTYDFAAAIDNRTGIRLERASGKLPPQGITTGYRVIDDLLYHRGWGRKELSVLLGAAKAGKTTALIDFGIGAWAAGHNVYYASCEVSREVISDRMDANIAEQAMMELGAHTHEVRDKVRQFADRARRADGTNAKFMIDEFPTGSLKVSELRRRLERFKQQGIVFDLVIVDYADIMSPERVTDSAIENSKSVYVDLRGLAIREGLAVLTATQSNRIGANANVIKAEHVAEDFNKVRIADIIISINRTEEERAAGRARLYFAASRNQGGEFTIEIEQAMDRMKFITKVLGFA
ncbi:DNA helicase [Burkholderia contaminans]|uniref:DNA helicase n=2 Tax=Burkholderia contaminans TaxID=488447 RepID=A0A3N8QQI9_9BURK|nr:DNA helicase [Burkholderia contaminans]